METAPVDLRQVGWDDPVLIALTSEQHDEVAERYRDVPGATADRIEATSVRGCWLAERDGCPVGCAAVLHGPEADGDTTGEVKRVYVRPSSRGQGVGRALMSGLEASARRSGLRRLVLATGPRQPEAIALYRRLGWQRVPNYGSYAATAPVRCFERVLWPDPPPLPANLPVRHRRSARALVLDPEDRVLLTHNLSRSADGVLREYWALPGGGLEPGESHADAAARELAEETGLTGIDLAGPMVLQDYWVTFAELVLHQVEELWWGRSEQILVSSAGLQADEDYLVGLRWWPVDELRDPTVVTYPRLLADLVVSLVRHGTPDEPFRIVADSTTPPGRPVHP